MAFTVVVNSFVADSSLLDCCDLVVFFSTLCLQVGHRLSFCIYYEFILAEDLCVHLPLLLIYLSFSGGFLVKEVFSFFNFNLCTGSKCISESFGWSGYIPCRIDKEGGFIRRDLSFHLPRINLAKAGRCVTDTLSKRFISVLVSTE